MKDSDLKLLFEVILLALEAIAIGRLPELSQIKMARELLK